MSSISEESPLAEQLKTAVQAKAIEYAWTQDEDDMSLAEYIVLMVANGKNQEQIAAELSGDLLQDASGIDEFTQWLSDYVAHLTGSGGKSEPTQQPDAMVQEEPQIPAAYDADLGDSAPDNAPKGPKSLHGGARGGRGGRNSTPGRGGFDSQLHRTRGNDRIGRDTRGAPKGPKGAHGKDPRAGMQKALNAMQQASQMPMAPGSPGQFNQIPPQQQMEFMAMMEQQARMLSALMPNMPGMNPNPQHNGHNGRSMFDRVERGRGGMRGRGRGGQNQNGFRKPSEATEGGEEGQSMQDTNMDSELTSAGSKDPTAAVCYFNLRCLNKECPYAHQSPAAPPGTEIDLETLCTFGAACKNTACRGRHPSPALITAHKAEQECKFFPNCNNPNCPFKHPTMPLCSFGASCTNKDCKFTHLKTKCKFNPCTNARCPFAHEPGQNRNMSQFTWTKDQGSQPATPVTATNNQDHVSNRRFVVEGEEELIKGENNEEEAGGGQEADAMTA